MRRLWKRRRANSIPRVSSPMAPMRCASRSPPSPPRAGRSASTWGGSAATATSVPSCGTRPDSYSRRWRTRRPRRTPIARPRNRWVSCRSPTAGSAPVSARWSRPWKRHCVTIGSTTQLPRSTSSRGTSSATGTSSCRNPFCKPRTPRLPRSWVRGVRWSRFWKRCSARCTP